MKKVIKLTESHLIDIVKRVIWEQLVSNQLSEVKKDVYKPEWTKDDTILSLYIAKYDIMDFPEFRVGGHKEAYDELANRVIGSTGNSLLRQQLNIEWLLGKDNNQSDVSDLQKQVVDEYGKMSRDELKQICRKIINHNMDGENYQNFLKQREAKRKGERAKEEEIKKKAAKDKLDAEFRRLGHDPSRMKLIGMVPKSAAE